MCRFASAIVYQIVILFFIKINFMAEAMSVESMIQAYWQRKNYFTIPRYSFKIKNGYSDIDMLAFKAKQGIHPECNDEDERNKTILVLCESKAHGSKNKIFYDDFEKLGFENFDTISKKIATNDLIHFIHSNVYYVLENGSLNSLIDLSTIDILRLQFVSTTLFSNEEKIQKGIEKFIKEIFIDIYKPINKEFKVELEITTHFDMINKLFLLVRKDESGKRYGNMILDFIREINRYLHVNNCAGIECIEGINGNTIPNKEKYSKLKELFKDELFSTLGEEQRDYTDISKKLNSFKK